VILRLSTHLTTTDGAAVFAPAVAFTQGVGAFPMPMGNDAILRTAKILNIALRF
jgi:hypothetical protein